MSVNRERKDEFDKIIRTVTSLSNTAEGTNNVYTNWASTYDQDMGGFSAYNGPLIVAKTISKVLDTQDARILDLGAGTGLVGIELGRLGYTNIDALDPIAAMLDEAKKKGIYKNFICDYLGSNKLDIADNTYDGQTISGVFVPGHADDSCFEEIIRIAKPGGYMVFIMNAAHLTLLEKIELRIKSLEEQGQWKLISREIKEDYLAIDQSDGKLTNGVLFTLKITKR